MSKWTDPIFMRQYAREWYHSHKSTYSSPEALARRRIRSKKWYNKNKAKIQATMKIWRLANPEKQTIYMRKATYGLTESQQKEILQKPCGICQKRKVTDIDHNHKTKEVRGGLCRSCNLGLGFFQDDTKLLKRALAWLC